jgi:hypothetical protein
MTAYVIKVISDTSYKLTRSTLLHINLKKDNILQKHNIISFKII